MATIEDQTMQITTYTVNAQGLAEIREFLAENHKLGRDHFDDAMIRAWARDAETQIGEGNDATIEIRSSNSKSGYTVCYTISDAGLDPEIVEVDE